MEESEKNVRSSSEIDLRDVPRIKTAACVREHV